MPKTLEDILKESEGSSVNEAIGVLAQAVKNQDADFKINLQSDLQELKNFCASFLEKIDEQLKLQGAILAKPDPVFPDFPEQKEFPTEINVKRPSWYQEPIEVDYEKIAEMVYARMAGTLQKINKKPIIIEKEIQITQPEEKKKGKSAGGAVRRTAQWNIFTFPNLPGTRKITSAGDGFTYYLDNALVINSETIRLNGATPLSQGVDYTFTGNKIVFINNQTGSQIEVRGQNK